jgi:hypothetical protein
MTAPPALPAAWLAQFDGTGLEDKIDVSAVLATVDAEGWPHIAYLSAGEVLALGADRLRLLLWPASRSAANMRDAGRAVLHAVADGAVWEARLAVRATRAAGKLLLIDVGIADIVRHAAPYADATSLIGFRLHDPIASVGRWRDNVARMRDW